MNNLELKGGDSLPNLDNCALMVSSWLTGNAPQTKPKTIDQLTAKAEHSIYAMQGDHTIGHIALVPHLNNFDLSFGGGRHSSGYFVSVKHLMVESLVVKPGTEGSGVGTTLLTEAMAQAAAKAHDHEHVVVSALACLASYPLFEKFGFDTFGRTEAWHDLHVTEPYDSMDWHQLSGLSKDVVSKIVWAP